METRADYVLVGGFVLVLLAGLVGAVLWLARAEFNEEVSYYDTYLTGSVTGLNKGSVVRYNGIPVGRVSEIRLDPQDPTRVRVTLEIEGGTVIKSDVVASLEIQGLTGGAFINLTGGSRRAEPLARKDGERYPVIASRPSGLEQVVNNAPQLLAQIIILANQLSDVLNDKNRAALSETLENLRSLSAAAAGHAGEIDSAISDAAVGLRELRDTLASAKATIDQLRDMIAPNSEAQTALRSVEDTAHKLSKTSEDMDALVQENRPALREFTGNGLNQVQQLVAQAQLLVGELSRVAESVERDPARFLYGDRREGYQPR